MRQPCCPGRPSGVLREGAAWGRGRPGAAARRTEGLARGTRGVAAAVRAAEGSAARLRRGGRAGRGADRALDRSFGDRAGGFRVPASRRRPKHREPAPLRRRHRPHGGLRLRARVAAARGGCLPSGVAGGLYGRRTARAARPGAAYGRGDLLPRALDGREHSLRRRSRRGAGGGRGQRPARLLLLVASRS